MLISGYKIQDNHGRTFWVSREHAEQLAQVLQDQDRIPGRARAKGSGSTARGAQEQEQLGDSREDDGKAQADHDSYWSEFIACAFIIPVEARTWYSVSVTATSAHPLVSAGEASAPLHWNSPGVDMAQDKSEFHIAGAHFDAQKGSAFAVRSGAR